MSRVTKTWVRCDHPGCAAERIENLSAAWDGWTRDAHGNDWCRTHSATLPTDQHIDVKNLAAGDDS